MISQRDPAESTEYQAHVERVRGQLVEEYGLSSRNDGVKIGLYHMGMLVISFPASDDVEYPYYYRGVQLKPEKEDTGV